MSVWKRLAVSACALPILAAAPPAASDPVFPARATGAEGTTMAIQAAGEAERAFQTEKERQRAKAEQERLAREAEAKRAAEVARLEQERVARETEAAAAQKAAADAAAAQVAKTAADAAAAEKATAMQARLDGAQSAGELFALADELKSSGDEAGSRAALRALIARFPENKLADVATTMLTGLPLAGAPASPAPALNAPAAALPPPPQVPAPAPVVAAVSAPAPAVAQTPQNNSCLAALARFNATRPSTSTAGTQVERQVFYGRYFERMLSDVPACRDDEATSARVRADVAANLRACQQQPGLNCTAGTPDADPRKVDADYDSIVSQAVAAAHASPGARP